MKPTPIDPKQYLSKELAAKQLGLSVRRTLERAGNGEIKSKKLKDPVTQRMQTMLLATDVERLAQQSRLPGLGATSTDLTRRYDVPTMPELPAPPEPPEKLWLTLEEAEVFCQLPSTVLRKLIKRGKLPALDVGVRKGGQYRVKRAELAALAGADCSANGQ